MDYTRHIVRVLAEAGPSGLSLGKVARHVHGEVNTLFAPVAYDDVRRDVAAWLQRQAGVKGGLVERLGRGTYRLNQEVAEQQELLLNFRDEPTPQPQTPQDRSLSLFPFES